MENAAPPELRAAWPFLAAALDSLAASRHGTTVAVGLSDGRLTLWRVALGSLEAGRSRSLPLTHRGTEMSGQFDAYHKWLGIPPEEQPPHYYRLLAIRIFEDDVDVIEAAADQRMAHLRTLQTGKNAELSQRLLNELAVARACLLDEGKRAQYNQRLKQQQTSRENASAASSAGEQTLAPPSGGPHKSSSAAPAIQPVAELDPIDNLADLDPLDDVLPPPMAGESGAGAGYYGPPQSAWPGYAPRRSKAWLIPAIIVASILLVLALIAFFAVLAVIVFYADSGVSTTPQISDSAAGDEGTNSALLPAISSCFGFTTTATPIGTPLSRTMMLPTAKPVLPSDRERLRLRPRLCRGDKGLLRNLRPRCRRSGRKPYAASHACNIVESSY